ncbi:MAG: hypothetical protein DRN81_05270 [Thermoproteota archaeon]|nr:MAG: hypothetical protein DRN81_05270 [Candidatus Korarchaeota archaeon]RLI84061.1 MAG: hypothetical protein DRP01_08505 [Archaeoglobales archaeon]
MLEVVKLKGGFSFRGNFRTKNIWLTTLEDFEKISQTFGGVYSQETTSKGVLHKLYVPDLNILFLYLEK